MSEINDQNCNHACDGCGVEGCASRNQGDFHIALHERSSVKKTIAIVSGKGGVGKSLVTSLLAAETQKRNKRVAILDGDITGPSQGHAFGIHAKASGDGELIYPEMSKSGIQIMSTNMLLEQDEQPVIWRGPMVAGILKQFYQEVFWDDVDYMYVDMPPGTSDVPLTLFQSIPLDGIIIVTSPQELVSMVVEKAINMANMMNVKILGIIENMSYVVCPTCDEHIALFGHSHVNDIAEKYYLTILAKLPLDPTITEACDNGQIEDVDVEEIKGAVDTILSL